MAVAGYTASLSIGGTSTALTNEACTLLTSGLLYQITAAAHQALDPTVSPIVQVSPNGSSGWITPTGNVTIDFTCGLITFATDQTPNTFVRVSSGNYFPLLAVAQARKCHWMMKRDIPDTTVYGAAGAHQRIPLLVDAEGTLEDLTSFREDLNTIAYDGAHRWFDDLFLPGATVLLAFQPGGSGNQTGRAFVKLDALTEDIAVDSIVIGTVSWKLASQVTTVPAATTGQAHVSWR